MFRILVAPFACLATLGAPAAGRAGVSDAPPAPAAPPRFGPPRPKMPMGLAEHRAFRRLEFEMMDLNRDGILTVDEFNARLIRELKIDDVARARRAIRIACGDVGETCTFEQFQAQGDREFHRVDANGDGLVTVEELKAAGGSMHSEQP